jgi:TolB-like protein
VLPFLTLTPRADLEFLRVGIADAIITQLANARQLRVRPTSAILAFDGQSVDPRRAARSLAAEYVVTGTLQDVGGRLRVSVQLIGAADGTPRWGDSYELPRSDLLALQDSVARRLVETLPVRLSEAERERLFRRYTANTAAYEAYLLGRAELARHTEPSTRAAIRAFSNALALDSGYALAWAGLGMASAEMHLRFASGPAVKAWRDSAQTQTLRALALDSSLAEVHQSLAAVARKSDFDWDRAISESRRAIALSSSLELPHYYIAGAFYHLGLLDEAEREVRTGAEVNPAGDHLEQLRSHAITALFDGRYQDALDALTEADRLGDRSVSGVYLAQAQYYAGRRADAEAVLRELITSGSASAATRSRAFLASIHAAAPSNEEALALLRSVERGDYMDHHVAYSVGATYAQLGDARNATRWLDRAVSSGFPCYPWYARDPLLAPIRADTGFVRLLADLRVTTERARERYATPRPPRP